MCNTDASCDTCKNYNRLYKETNDKYIETSTGYCELPRSHKYILVQDNDTCKNHKQNLRRNY